MNSKQQIGVLGIGAIGTVIAYQLLQNNLNELFYFSRTRYTHLKLISEGHRHELPVDIKTTISKPIHLDWLIICLKEHQYQNAKDWFPKLIQPHTRIAVIRNGLQLKRPLLAFTDDDHILECMIDAPTQLSHEGFYQNLSTPILTVPQSDLASAFEFCFKHSKLTINQVEDFKTESWKKLCESTTLGALLCLHNDTCHIFKSEKLQHDYRELMNESIQVAKADGALIDNRFTNQMLNKLMNYPDTKGSSMLTDMRNCKPIELGAKNGIISQLGKAYQIDTPINDMIIRALS
ncbi:ketopantoate reductase C-terminal domain-containing protein [uncultured Psychroserpens sp.]|uniref:ketopantoate reductase C-terminal domain-containing protein n=1 Tax=uncultured Psychroserpens sp. TaxID=255436 RepID=UPI0026283B30|nr:ketopantoate reductase C-terminal domain-containing protein [uncultured Psychroserpens sp.]